MLDINCDQIASENAIPYVSIPMKTCVAFRLHKNVFNLPKVLLPLVQSDVESNVRERYQPSPGRPAATLYLSPAVETPAYTPPVFFQLVTFPTVLQALPPALPVTIFTLLLLSSSILCNFSPVLRMLGRFFDQDTFVSAGWHFHRLYRLCTGGICR